MEESTLVHSQESVEPVNSNTMDAPMLATLDQCNTMNGRIFASLEEAESEYKLFAQENGFAVRLGKVHRDRNGAIRKRTMKCNLAETPATSSFSRDIPTQRARLPVSTNCLAYCRVSKDAVTSEWKVIAFSNDHNHPLLSSSDTRVLASSRILRSPQKELISTLHSAGVRTADIYHVIDRCSSKESKITYKDVANYVTTIGMENSLGDAQKLLSLLQDFKEKDDDFVYEYTLDCNNRLEHVFWMDGSSRRKYSIYGDVLVFDTTYKLNRYNMPFALFCGVNQHGRTILFAGALIANETVQTFTWLFTVFKKAVFGRSPVSILTDQDGPIETSISIVFPQAKHAFCMWHIARKFPSWFRNMLGNNYFKFVSKMYKMLDEATEANHETLWNHLLQQYDLMENNDLQRLYECKRKWMPCLLTDVFFAGMTTSQRAESMNSVMKKLMDRSTDLSTFIKRYMEIQDSRDLMEAQDRVKNVRNCPVVSSNPIEQQYAKVFTLYALGKIQHEVKQLTEYFCDRDLDGKYNVRRSHATLSYQVAIRKNPDNVTEALECNCSCREFEFKMIICRHILRVFVHENIQTIHSKYIPVRWCREVNESMQYLELQNQQHKMTLQVAQEGAGTQLQGEDVRKHLYNQGMGVMRELVRTASNSVQLMESLLQTGKLMLKEYQDKLRKGESHTEASSIPSGSVQNPPTVTVKGRPRRKRLQSASEENAKSKKAKRSSVVKD